MITFLNTGISSEKTKSGRTLVYTDIQSGNTIYHWTIYVPQLSGKTLSTYLTENASVYEADIIAKEAIWAGMPHTETITEPMTGEMITVDIPKERIVKPDIPDYIETVSNYDLDIAAIKRLLQVLSSTILIATGKTDQQIKDLATIYDYWDVGIPYKIGDLADYKGTPYKCIQAHTSQIDWSPNLVPALWNVISTSENWTAGVAYKVNDVVKYGSFSYKCLQAHTSQAGWEPPNVPALWSKI